MEKANIPERIAALRKAMKEKNIDAWTRVPMVPEVTAKVDAGQVEDIQNDWYVGIADKLETL